MTKWLVGIPAWGDRCVEVFLAVTLPALREAFAGLPYPVKFILHTDQPDRLRAAFVGLEVEFRPPPSPDGVYQMFAAAHRDVLTAASPGDRVSLLCADTIFSAGAFKACEARFQQGYETVVAAGPRTAGKTLPPIGAAPRELLHWAMTNRHPLMEDAFWGRGRIAVPSFVFFETGDNIVLRAFHLHPVALVKTAAMMNFVGTVDDGLPAIFERDRIYVAADPDEMSFLEISPPDRRMPRVPHVMTIDSIVGWARRRTLPVHWWFASHRVVMRGDPAKVDDSAWEGILGSPLTPVWGPAAYRGEIMPVNPATAA